MPELNKFKPVRLVKKSEASFLVRCLISSLSALVNKHFIGNFSWERIDPQVLAHLNYSWCLGHSQVTENTEKVHTNLIHV